MNFCCVECFRDPVLRDAVIRQRNTGDCSYCGSTNVACGSLAFLGQMIRDGIHRAYREAADEAGPHDSEDDVYIWNDPRNAPTMLEILRDEEGAFSDALEGSEEDLLGDLLEASAPIRRRMKDLLEPDPLGDWSASLYLRDGILGAQDSLFDSSWLAFKYRVQHVARFFDGQGLGAPRHSLLKRVQDQLWKLQVVLPQGTHLFRARPVWGDVPLPHVHSERLREIGPAPLRMSRGSRMSPPGISYTYLSIDAETALSEVSRAGTSKYWVGEFTTRSELTIVDLSFTAGHKSQSIFDPLYDHRHRLLYPALSDFAREVSRPISANDEALDYVPTQVLTEFLRSKHANGVQYTSARQPKGMNLTLFCGYPLSGDEVDLDPGAPKSWRSGFTPFTEWLNLVDIQEHPPQPSP